MDPNPAAHDTALTGTLPPPAILPPPVILPQAGSPNHTPTATGTILDVIAAEAHERVLADRAEVSLAEMRARALDTPIREGFRFEQALATPGLSFICEVKKASPSKGLISADFPYLDIARDYEVGGAAAISVLTEPKRFLGSDVYLRDIVQTVSIPVLRKDFTVDAYQIYQARAMGASAVLLICAIISDQQLSEYLGLAEELGLSCLTEAHDIEEIDRAVQAGARVIGVNNRNLHDFSVNMSNSSSLRSLVPSDRIFVSESGVATPEDAADAARMGADAVLVGEALMRSSDRRGFLTELQQAAALSSSVTTAPSSSANPGPSPVNPSSPSVILPQAGSFTDSDEQRTHDGGDPACDKVTRGGTATHYPAVKICGISRADDVPVLNQMMPDYVGFVFHPDSRRHVDLTTARHLRELLDERITTVGVFVDAAISQVVEAVESGAISMVQLHGSEDRPYIAWLRQALPATPIIKAVPVTDETSIESATGYDVDYLMVDNPRPGSGESFDWDLLGQLPDEVPVFLAGGLTPDTVADAARLGVYAVDVSSGVETDGVKDPGKIRSFILQVRGARQEGQL